MKLTNSEGKKHSSWVKLGDKNTDGKRSTQTIEIVQ